MTTVDFSSIQPSAALFMHCYNGYITLFIVACFAFALNLFIVIRILIKQSLRRLSFFTYILYGSCSTSIYMIFYLAQAAVVCGTQDPDLFLMRQSNCFLIASTVYTTNLVSEVSILLLSADRALAYMKPLLYRTIDVAYAIRLCFGSFVLILLELSAIYFYQLLNDSPVFCTSSGAGLNPNSQRIYMPSILAIRISSFLINILLYSHRWITPQNSVQASSNFDTDQKEWLTKFKEEQKPFFRILLFLTLSNLIFGTPFAIMEYVVAYMGDASRQKMFRSIAVGIQYFAYIVDCLSLLILNRQIRPKLPQMMQSSKIFNSNQGAPTNNVGD